MSVAASCACTQHASCSRLDHAQRPPTAPSEPGLVLASQARLVEVTPRRPVCARERTPDVSPRMRVEESQSSGNPSRPMEANFSGDAQTRPSSISTQTPEGRVCVAAELQERPCDSGAGRGILHEPRRRSRCSQANTGVQHLTMSETAVRQSPRNLEPRNGTKTHL